MEKKEDWVLLLLLYNLLGIELFCFSWLLRQRTSKIMSSFIRRGWAVLPTVLENLQLQFSRLENTNWELVTQEMRKKSQTFQYYSFILAESWSFQFPSQKCIEQILNDNWQMMFCDHYLNTNSWLPHFTTDTSCWYLEWIQFGEVQTWAG